MQPGAHLALGKIEIGVGPGPWPPVLGPVEPGRPGPVLPREVEAVADAHPALFGRVDHEQPAERPEGLPAKAPPRFLVKKRHAPVPVEQFAGGGQAGEAAADDHHIRFIPHQASPASTPGPTLHAGGGPVCTARPLCRPRRSGGARVRHQPKASAPATA